MSIRCVEAAGPEGISQQELGRKLGHGKLEARTICRNLQRRGLVANILNDQGRQRVTNFVVKNLEHLSPSSNQFLAEKKKNEQLTAVGLASCSVKQEVDSQAAAVDDLAANGSGGVGLKQEDKPVVVRYWSLIGK